MKNITVDECRQSSFSGRGLRDRLCENPSRRHGIVGFPSHSSRRAPRDDFVRPGRTGEAAAKVGGTGRAGRPAQLSTRRTGGRHRWSSGAKVVRRAATRSSNGYIRGGVGFVVGFVVGTPHRSPVRCEGVRPGADPIDAARVGCPKAAHARRGNGRDGIRTGRWSITHPLIDIFDVGAIFVVEVTPEFLSSCYPGRCYIFELTRTLASITSGGALSSAELFRYELNFAEVLDAS